MTGRLSYASLANTVDVSANKSAGSWIIRIGLEVVSGSANHLDNFQNRSNIESIFSIGINNGKTKYNCFESSLADFTKTGVL